MTPDGTQLALSLDNGTVSLWDVPTGQERQSFEPYSRQTSTVAFNQNQATLASASLDGTLKIWNVDTLEELIHRACDGLRSYLVSNPNITEGDRALCNIPPPETSPTD
nr:hypothetical protein [Geitlerinema sp. P-1104]